MDHVTAFVVYGAADISEPGIAPSHLLSFSQSTPPTWTLQTFPDGTPTGQPSAPPVTWTTSEAHALDDMFLMIGLLVDRNPALLDILGDAATVETLAQGGFDDKTREALYERCRALGTRGRAALTILDDSVLVRYTRTLSHYTMQVELSMTSGAHMAATRI